MSHFPKIDLQPVVIPTTPENNRQLDEFIRALEALSVDREPESTPLAEGLAALDALFNLPSATDSEGRWKAERYADFLGSGAALSLKEQSGVHHLNVSRRRDGSLFNGVWALLQGEQAKLFTFNISGGQFILSDGEDEHSCAAPPGAAWASSEDILGFIPDWLGAGLRSAAQALKPPSRKKDHRK